MPCPTKNEFVELLRTRTSREIVDQYLLAGTPFAFDGKPNLYDVFRTSLSDQLGLQASEITIIGSGRIGFSLDPNRFGNPYAAATSDIDTAVVSADLFDTAWHQLCSRGRSTLSLNPRVLEAMREHRINNVFYGYIEPTRLNGVITISATWFRTFKNIGIVPGLAGLDVQGRLYRTLDHLRYHQVYSLTGIKAQLGIR